MESRYKAMCRTSSLLLDKMLAVRVSAVAWAEFLRHVRIHDQAAMDALQQRVRVDAMTLDSAARAVALLAQRNVAEKLCDRCLGSLVNGNPCSACGRSISRQQRMNDAMIAGTADTTDGVAVLYAYDKGVLAFAQYMTTREIRRPEHPDGALFDQATKASPAIVSAPRPKTPSQR